MLRRDFLASCAAIHLIGKFPETKSNDILEIHYRFGSHRKVEYYDVKSIIHYNGISNLAKAINNDRFWADNKDGKFFFACGIIEKVIYGNLNVEFDSYNQLFYLLQEKNDLRIYRTGCYLENVTSPLGSISTILDKYYFPIELSLFGLIKFNNDTVCNLCPFIKNYESKWLVVPEDYVLPTFIGESR